MIRLRWTPPGGRADRESGISTLEVVLLTPLIVFVLLVMVALGMMVNDKGSVESASADAARMGSLQRDWGTATAQAQGVADSDLAGSVSCEDGDGVKPRVTAAPPFAAGGLYTVTVSCTVDYFGRTVTLTSVSVSPIDRYRETN